MRFIKSVIGFSVSSYCLLANSVSGAPADSAGLSAAAPLAAADSIAAADPSDLSQNGQNILGILNQGQNMETGFEDADYGQLEAALAAEMFNMNNLLQSVEPSHDHSDHSNDGDNKEARNARSTSLEGRLLRAKNKGKAGRQMPRWMKLAYEMKKRNNRH